jgi:hypothetical protein
MSSYHFTFLLFCSVLPHPSLFTTISISAILAFASVFVSRYKWLLFPALILLGWVAYQIVRNNNINTSASSTTTTAATTTTIKDLASPLMIGTGLILMYQTSVGSWSHSSVLIQDGGSSPTITTINSGWYWVGESMVIFMFVWNSLTPPSTSSTNNRFMVVVAGVAVLSMLAALWFRGKFWNYIIVLGLEIMLALFIAVSFPIFEMILEAIVDDKLKKVGDKVRAQHAYMEKYYTTITTTTTTTTAKRKEKD